MAKPTLHDDVLEILGSRIAALAYPAGTMLRTDGLEAEFEVSRTVVRETLKVLESMHMIAVRRAVGITVLDQSSWNVFDPRVIRWRLSGSGRGEQLKSLTDLRFAVEPVAARFAATDRTPDQGRELERIAKRMESSGGRGDLEEFLALDIAYHRLLLIASGNDLFASLGDAVAAVLTGRTVHRLMPRKPKPEALQLHGIVAHSVREGEGEHAESAMRALLAEVEQQFTSS